MDCYQKGLPEMKIGIMQPYFFPYIGYWQLISSVDVFVVYDNIQYTKKGWINRNRMLQNGAPTLFSLPLKKDSDFLDVRQRSLADEFPREKLSNKIKGAYVKAPYFQQVFPLVEGIISNDEKNLFFYLLYSIAKILQFLEIETRIIISSEIPIDHNGLKSQDKVLALCKVLKGETYINTIGGTKLYSFQKFREEGLRLKFIESAYIEYAQFGNDFVPWLSIIDIMMFNPKEKIKEYLKQYILA
jgi:hypothetical protein